jgi:hypothetical protein
MFESGSGIQDEKIMVGSGIKHPGSATLLESTGTVSLEKS